MKKILAFAILAALLLGAVWALTGCTGLRASAYENPERYSVGDAVLTDKIDRIEIDWASGSVRLVAHAGDAIQLTEAAEEGMPEELRMRWWLDGSTLRVRFAESDAGLRLFGNWRKELTLAVPEGLRLDSVVIKAASAEVDIDDLATEALCVSTASGDMRIICEAATIQLDSASGGIHLKQMGSAASVDVDTASGRIDAELEHVDAAELESASGGMQISAASLDSLSLRSTSGEVDCALASVPSMCSIHAVSGEVALSLPADADFTAEVRTTSGDFESDFALRRDGGSYVCGNGDAHVRIETTSGDVSIRPN